MLSPHLKDKLLPCRSLTLLAGSCTSTQVGSGPRSFIKVPLHSHTCASSSHLASALCPNIFTQSLLNHFVTLNGNTEKPTLGWFNFPGFPRGSRTTNLATCLLPHHPSTCCLRSASVSFDIPLTLSKSCLPAHSQPDQPLDQPLHNFLT